MSRTVGGAGSVVRGRRLGHRLAASLCAAPPPPPAPPNTAPFHARPRPKGYLVPSLRCPLWYGKTSLLCPPGRRLTPRLRPHAPLFTTLPQPISPYLTPLFRPKTHPRLRCSFGLSSQHALGPYPG
eukprot:264177-Rhodomonas_salina.1